jgi:hypothetical protein
VRSHKSFEGQVLFGGAHNVAECNARRRTSKDQFGISRKIAAAACDYRLS